MKTLLRALAFASAILVLPYYLEAQNKLKICKSGNNVFAAKRCKAPAQTLNISTLTGATGPAGATGATGATGQTGADGILGVYGDGSAGPLSVTADTIWSTTPPSNNNLQFTTCSISSGVTLFVPSGTVIRCTGTAAIAGTISVVAPRNGGISNLGGTLNEVLTPSIALPSAGISPRSAGMGELGKVNAGVNTFRGGAGGLGVTGGVVGDSARFLGSLLRGANLSGGGGASAVGEGNFGIEVEAGGGGGSFALVAKEAVTISGTINADAGFFLCTSGGCGAGAGGVVVIASKTSISFSGSGNVSVQGGDGANSGASTGVGGAGGGGIIQYISPSAPTVSGTNSIVTAGTIGSAAAGGLNSATLRQGGGGGGGCGGAGAPGGHVLETNGAQTANGGFAAGDGIAVSLALDPAVFLLNM